MIAIYMDRNVVIECDQEVKICELSTGKFATKAAKLIDVQCLDRSVATNSLNFCSTRRQFVIVSKMNENNNINTKIFEFCNTKVIT